jgi:PAS domain S-box-containing protein
MLEDGPMLVAASPILTSSNQGPSRGTFVLGRRLPGRWADRLGELTQLWVEVRRMDRGALEGPWQGVATRLAEGQKRVVEATDSRQVAGYIALKDLGGTPVLLIRAVGPRSIYARGVSDLRVFVLAVVATSLASFALMLVLLEWLVLARLRRLDRGLDEVARAADPAGRVAADGNDELATLACSVNHTLDALDRSQKALRQAHDQLERRVAERTAELERAVAALRDSEERYRNLVEKVNDVIFALDSDGIVTYVSPVVERVAGWTVMEVIGMHFLRLIHPDDHKALMASFERTLDGSLAPAEFRLLAKGGRELNVRSSSQPIVEKGRALGIRGVITDLTAEREAQARVRFLASAVENIKECVSITDLEGRILFVNRAFQETYGFTGPELLGHSISLVQAASTLPGLPREITEATLAGGWTGEILNRRKDGSEFPILLSTSVLRDEAGAIRGLIGVATDMRERHELEEQLRASQRMEAIGHLAGGIAHDFNNLLTVVLGATEIVRRALPASSPLQTEVDTVRNAVSDGSRLTSSLLAYARQQRLQPEELNLARVIGAMVPMLRRVLPEHIELSFVVGPEALGVRADKGQLEQVLMNLCVNARDAMPRGGVLSIATACVNVDVTSRAAHQLGTTGRYAKITVTDTGSGMDEETLKHLFEPFYTTKDLSRGTGLGLATVYGIVKQHDGTIEVTSTPGQGTTFDLYLPAIEVVHGASIGAAQPQPVARGSETVLVVEDQEDLRRTVVRYLALDGYHVLEAKDGAEALELLERHGDAIDLVFSDLIMPGVGGWELYSRRHALARKIPFLFTSGHDERLTREGLVEGRGVGFIAKPFDLLEVTRRIRELVDEAQASA